MYSMSHMYGEKFDIIRQPEDIVYLSGNWYCRVLQFANRTIIFSGGWYTYDGRRPCHAPD